MTSPTICRAADEPGRRPAGVPARAGPVRRHRAAAVAAAVPALRPLAPRLGGPGRLACSPWSSVSASGDGRFGPGSWPTAPAGSSSTTCSAACLVLRQLHHLPAAVPVRLHGLLIIWLSLLTGIPDREDSADFYCLLLGRRGHVVMASANHLLMVFIGVEMAACRATPWPASSRASGRASEAALKYVVYGGGAGGRHALRHQPDRRQVRHRLSARRGRRLLDRHAVAEPSARCRSWSWARSSS